MLSRKVIFITILLSFYINSSVNGSAATVVAWGDVVDVYYELYLNAAYSPPTRDEGPIPNIYLGPGYAVPSHVLEVVPDAKATYLEKFKEGIVGAIVNQPWEFKIDAADAYTNPEDELYGFDLYFRVTVTQIVYDASTEESSSTTSPSTSTSTSAGPIGSFESIIILAGGAFIVVAGFGIWSYQSSRSMKSVVKGERSSTSMRAETIQKEKDQLKELRELTESFETSKEIPEEKEVKFRRIR